jgi:hypothetical protein
LRHAKGAGHGLAMNVLGQQAELAPRAEREVEAPHDLGRDAAVDELLECDSHGAELVHGPLHGPHLGQVGVEVHKGVDREHGHLLHVVQRDPAPHDPLPFVGLNGVQVLCAEAVLGAQRVPRQVPGLEIVPRDDAPRLVPEPKDLDALQGRDLDCMVAVGLKYKDIQIY